MRAKSYLGGLIVVFAITSSPSSAQDLEGPECELHIWPAEVLEVGSVGTLVDRDGVTDRGGLIGALFDNGNPDRQEILAATLFEERQLELLDGANPVETLALDSECQVVTHFGDLFDAESRDRQTDSIANRYYELKIDSIYFNSHPIYGRDILAFYTFRIFSEEGQYEKRIRRNKRVKTGRISFEGEAEIAASVTAIEEAFIGTFRKFATESVR